MMKDKKLSPTITIMFKGLDHRNRFNPGEVVVENGGDLYIRNRSDLLSEVHDRHVDRADGGGGGVAVEVDAAGIQAPVGNPVQIAIFRRTNAAW